MRSDQRSWIPANGISREVTGAATTGAALIAVVATATATACVASATAAAPILSGSAVSTIHIAVTTIAAVAGRVVNARCYFA